MKINSINSLSFKSNNTQKKDGIELVKIPINGYKTEIYNKAGSFIESIEFKRTNDGKYFVLNKDKEGKNSFSMSIPDILCEKSYFNGCVLPNRFCILSEKKEGQEISRILIGSNGVIPLYPEYYAENGCESLFLTKEAFKEFRHLTNEVLNLPMVPYDYFDTARIALNNYVYYSEFKD